MPATAERGSRRANATCAAMLRWTRSSLISFSVNPAVREETNATLSTACAAAHAAFNLSNCAI